ncbi:hypothetical protein HOB10_03945 [Candidatus Parcubacteria bacterium]|jgi:hypothetical protein|nr:hypothetical protein [Candidatus Parcubacteria bacterium]
MRFIVVFVTLFFLANIPNVLAAPDFSVETELCKSTAGMVDVEYKVGFRCICPEKYKWFDGLGCLTSSSGVVDYSSHYNLIVLLAVIGILMSVFLYIFLMYRKQ